jgi:hypothetical protein
MQDGSADHAYYHGGYRLVNGKIRESFSMPEKSLTRDWLAIDKFLMGEKAPFFDEAFSVN